MLRKNYIKVFLAVCPLFFSFLGCNRGSGDTPEIGLVHGSVTMDGKPLSGIAVVFTPESGRPSIGFADSDGRYELIYVRTTKGAKVGHHKVSFMWINHDAEDEDAQASGRGDGPSKMDQIPIPKRYSSDNTTLQAVVEPGDNTFDFSLEST